MIRCRTISIPGQLYSIDSIVKLTLEAYRHKSQIIMLIVDSEFGVQSRWRSFDALPSRNAGIVDIARKLERLFAAWMCVVLADAWNGQWETCFLLKNTFSQKHLRCLGSRLGSRLPQGERELRWEGARQHAGRTGNRGNSLRRASLRGSETACWTDRKPCK